MKLHREGTKVSSRSKPRNLSSETSCARHKPVGFMLSLSCVIFTRPHRSAVPLETWLTKNKAFKIRVTSYEEKDANASGTNYVFESTSKGSTAWHEIMTLRHDDRPDLPKNKIRFLNDETGYLFMEWMYAVTTDGGHSWSVWDATRDVPDWLWSKFGVIKDVMINLDGSGTMLLTPITDANINPQAFTTHDFGRHWEAQR